MLCEQLRDRNIQTRIFIGARSSDDLIGVDDFSALGLPLIISTDDGSAGQRGFVTQPFEQFLDSTIAKNFIVYTCGPEPMMKRTSEIASMHGLKIYASLEARMACGFGVCVGCIVETQAQSDQDSSYQRVCVEGPVFDASEVLW